jgi:polyhydroxyalkanoate synthesis regulator phasin
VRDFVENVQRTVDEMQTRFDSRVRDLVSSVTHMNALEQEVADLRKRVATLEDEIARMQQAARPSRPSPTRRTPPR